MGLNVIVEKNRKYVHVSEKKIIIIVNSINQVYPNETRAR